MLDKVFENIRAHPGVVLGVLIFLALVALYFIVEYISCSGALKVSEKKTSSLANRLNRAHSRNMSRFNPCKVQDLVAGKHRDDIQTTAGPGPKKTLADADHSAAFKAHLLGTEHISEIDHLDSAEHCEGVSQDDKALARILQGDDGCLAN